MHGVARKSFCIGRLQLKIQPRFEGVKSGLRESNLEWDTSLLVTHANIQAHLFFKKIQDICELLTTIRTSTILSKNNTLMQIKTTKRKLK